MEKNGCKECKKRVVGCHATCKDYQKWYHEYLNDKAKRRKHESKYGNYFYHK